MIEFSRFSLNNKLKVLVHEDRSTPMVAVNVLYNVGSKDESPSKTGFAHLFEHLMFGGSENANDFDTPLQLAGGESNAFTNNDLTNFYDIVPANNIDTVLWLESDRMRNLNFNPKSLATQQKVVVEEFKETCLNQPYGDAWHHLSEMAFKVHPYRWPTIGLVPAHIEEAALKDVEHFFEKYYNPNNAILVLAGNISLEEAKEKVNKWFGHIEEGPVYQRQLPQEPIQRKYNYKRIENGVPMDALFMAFHMPGRMDKGYYAADLLSDILSNGRSSRFYSRLLKDKGLFSQIEAYISGHVDPGLFIVEGRIMPGVSEEEARASIWEELNKMATEEVEEKELAKLKNKMESSLVFSECSILNRAINLAFFELMGDADLINTEGQMYQAVTTKEIKEIAKEIFTESNCSELIYIKK